MTQITLSAAVALVTEAMEEEEKCPFKLEVETVDTEEDEAIPYDDKDAESVYKEQKNNGGTLGENLISGKQGVAGTTLNPPPDAEPEHRQDKHGDFAVRVKESCGIEAGTFPAVNAAHHIIPGNASLKPSSLKPYMTKGAKVSVEIMDGGKSVKKTWTVKEYIGYNINGAHNGVWLAASYAIRKGKTDAKDTWSTLASKKEDWCVNYIAASAKAVEAQFHDTHEPYSTELKNFLNGLTVKLATHQKTCAICRNSLTDIAPPYIVKDTLYALSANTKVRLQGHPLSWKLPYITTEKWKDKIFNKRGGIKQEFLDAYNDSQNGRVILL